LQGKDGCGRKGRAQRRQDAFSINDRHLHPQLTTLRMTTERAQTTWKTVCCLHRLVEVGLSDDLLVVEGGELAVEGCSAWLRRSC
jgi:hypothetical protein